MAEVKQLDIALLGIIALVIVYSFLGTAFEHFHFHYIHETGAGILIGLLFGVIIYFAHDFSQFEFNEEVFFLALLPPMIFSGGYNLKKKEFFKNIKYILIYGLVGTLVSFFVIFGLTYLVNKLQWITPIGKHGQTIILSTALMIKFSATISATDSVAALTLIKPSEHPKLFSVIFGQGMVNDAVAIILFKVVGSVFEDGAEHATALWSGDDIKNITSGNDGIDGVTVVKILWQFLYTVVASILIGGFIALLCTWMFRTFRFMCNPVTEVVVVYLFGILSYLISEVLDMSGVLTVLVAGVVMAHFNFYNISMTGQVATGTTYQSIAFIAEAVVFIYLGLSFMHYVTTYTISLGFFALQLLICVISRLTAIFALAYSIKLFSKWILTANEMAIVSTAGTIRGSVAFALILTVEPATEDQKMAVEIIKSTVLFMVFLTTILLGGMMPWFIKVFLGPSKHPQERESVRVSLLQQQKQQQQEKKQQTIHKGFFKRIDEKYLKKFFIYDYQRRKDDIKKWKKFFKMNSPDYKGAQFSGIMKANIRQTIIQQIEIQKSMRFGNQGGPTSLLGTEHF